MSASLSPAPPSTQYWEDRRWIHDHYEQLVQRYANQWVAVHEGIILAAGVQLGLVEDEARSRCPSADIVIQFVDDGSLIF